MTWINPVITTVTITGSGRAVWYVGCDAHVHGNVLRDVAETTSVLSMMCQT